MWCYKYRLSRKTKHIPWNSICWKIKLMNFLIWNGVSFMKTSCNQWVSGVISRSPWHRDWLHDVGILEATDVPVLMSRSSPQLNHQKKTIEQWKQTWLFRVGDDGKGKRDYSKPLGFFSWLNWQVLVILAYMANRRTVPTLNGEFFWTLYIHPSFGICDIYFDLVFFS